MVVLGEEDCEVGHKRVIEGVGWGGWCLLDMACGMTSGWMDGSKAGWMTDWILGWTGGWPVGQRMGPMAHWMG